MRKTTISLIVLLILSIPGIVFSTEPSNTFPFQGRLEDSNGTPISSTVDMTFRMYDGQNNTLWSETRSVTIVAGEFDLLLGESTPIDFSVNENATYIGIQIGAEPEMSPRQKIGESIRAGYALRAALALSITDTAITESKLADNAVTVSKLASSAVTDDKLASNAVTADKLADNAVTPTKLAGSGGTALTSGSDGNALVSNGDGTFAWKNLNEMKVTTIDVGNLSNYNISSDDLGLILMRTTRTYSYINTPDPAANQWKHLIIRNTSSGDLRIRYADGGRVVELINTDEYVHLFSNGDKWYEIGGRY